MSDESKRVEQLEREVARLAQNVNALERQRDALLREAKTRHDAPPKHHSWIGRLILLALTAAAGSAAFFMFRSQDFSLSELTALGSDVAAIDTDPRLLACVLLIGAAAAFYVAHRRFLFGFASMAALYGTHWSYFADQPAALNLSDLQYFWVSTVLLTGAYSLLAYLSVHECRRAPRGRRRWAFFALVNSIAFSATVWPSIEAMQPERIWLFRSFFALLLTGFAVLAETPGPHRNPVFQLYVVMAALMTNLALAAVLSETWLAVILAVECAGLALTYRQSGFILFKLIGLLVLIAASVYGMRLAAGSGGDVVAWAAGIVMAFILLGTAALYTHASRERAPETRRTSGHWSYLDTPLDIDASRLALFHGAGATLILIAFAVFNLSENGLLPFTLAGAAVALIVLGALVMTPAIEFAGVLILASAQAAYAYGLFGESAPSVEPMTLRALAGALVALSLAAAWRWDYVVRRDASAGPLEYASAIAAPYVAAGLVTAAVVWESFVPELVPAIHVVGALACLIAFRNWNSGGMRIVALTLMIAGAVSFMAAYAWPALTGDAPSMYWWWFLGIALAPVAGERILAIQFGIDRRPGADASRTVLVVLACLTGLAGIFCGAPESYRAWGWLAMAAVAALCGIAFREGRYRWIGMIAMVAAGVLVLSPAAEGTDPVNVYPFIGAALVVAVVLLASWAAAMRGAFGGQGPRGMPGDEG